MLNNRIILKDPSVAELESWCEERLGGGLSRRTLQRAKRGLVAPAGKVVEQDSPEDGGGSGYSEAESQGVRLFGGGRLSLEERDLSQVRSIIERAASESYLEVGEIGFETREGEITIRAKIYESEEEYDG